AKVPLPYAYRLPGVRDGIPARSFSRRLWSLVGGGAVLVFLLLTVVSAPWWAYLALAAVALGAWGFLARSTIGGELHRRRLYRAVASYQPEVAIAFAGKSGGPWQLAMWEPYLVRSGLTTIIVNTHAAYLDMIVPSITVPLVQMADIDREFLEPLVVPTLHTFYYVQNAKTNALFMSFTRLTHVWLNHGDSDKPANFNERHARYDKIVVCGQAGIDRYAANDIHIDPEKFVVVGRPQAGDVVKARVPIADISAPTVVYAPTWHGVDGSINFSSLSCAKSIVEALVARECTVIFRPHPLSKRWQNRLKIILDVQEILRADHEATGRQHVFGAAAEEDWSVVDCSNHADAMISDVSSVVSDFLQSEKPYAMVSMHAGVDEFRAEFALAQTGYVITRDLENLDDVLDDLLGADPLSEARSARKRYVLGDFDGDESAEAFSAFVRSLAPPAQVAVKH
ncbi:MAG: hypothetical protein JWP10_207, partial [Nocardioidaceae bacterium]|nr:hypothetical protein [Nocardioidaceae bacterium]